MVAVGRALMTNPELLILDEATEGLAPLVRGEIWRCLAGLKASGLAILVIDKNVEPLKRLADCHYILERGAWSGAAARPSSTPDPKCSTPISASEVTASEPSLRALPRRGSCSRSREAAKAGLRPTQAMTGIRDSSVLEDLRLAKRAPYRQT
jgi:ABC-type sugar transport system ATPase subunit